MSASTHAETRPPLLALVAKGIVRPSFERCCAHGTAIFDVFYATLAERLPGVGAMFANTDMEKQNQLIRAGIAALIDDACGVPTARSELERLGDLHSRRRLDIRPDMYAEWVDSLMQMVAEFDRECTDVTEAAWREVLSPGIAVMAARYDPAVDTPA
jgi:hemoglobin-like flavoprotein